MSTPFNAQRGLIVVQVRLFGPSGDLYARLALDTGASVTTVRSALLTMIGYDPASLPRSVRITTGSRVETAARLAIDRIEALEQERLSFPIVAHTLPPSASVDGLLGLDFLRGHVLTLDFRQGEITLM